jgi:hypothetical protein
MPAPAVISMIYDGKVKVTFSPRRHTYMVDVPGVVKKAWFPSVTGVLGVIAKPQLTRWASQRTIEYIKKRVGEFESSQGAPPFLIDTKHIHSYLDDAEEGWQDTESTSIGSLAHRFLEAELKFRAGEGPRPERPKVDPVLAPDFTPGMIDAANNSITAGLSFFDEHEVTPIMLERVLFHPADAYVGTCDFIGYVDGELVIGDHKTSKRLYSEYRLQLAAYVSAYFSEFNSLIKTRYLWNIKKDGTGLDVEKHGVETYQEDLDCFKNCLGLYSWQRQNDQWKKGVAAQPLPDNWLELCT